MFNPNTATATLNSMRDIFPHVCTYRNFFYVILMTPLILNPSFNFFLVQKMQVREGLKKKSNFFFII